DEAASRVVHRQGESAVVALVSLVKITHKTQKIAQHNENAPHFLLEFVRTCETRQRFAAIPGAAAIGPLILRLVRRAEVMRSSLGPDLALFKMVGQRFRECGMAIRVECFDW